MKLSRCRIKIEKILYLVNFLVFSIISTESGVCVVSTLTQFQFTSYLIVGKGHRCDLLTPYSLLPARCILALRFSEDDQEFWYWKYVLFVCVSSCRADKMKKCVANHIYFFKRER